MASRKIKVRIFRRPDATGKWAVIAREVNEPDRCARHEVLATNGKWREKSEGEAIFEDEKFEVEEV